MINGRHFQLWIVLFVIMDKNYSYLKLGLYKRFSTDKRRKYPFFKEIL
ncbi:hypothetical protein LEP1GSC116_3287 [Leptospira interrogans serovar Icterohaemorrhagiae str. Verdun HP]|uniref:Uncharacterized protein n=2 Tax=Leptospira interrogans TaxID=173 RepID=M6RHA3_LEPIR|nr:hypothetical protein LEP1GSC150_1701 [Leptospira interrogans serovar Copenhageni str. LT2050]EMO07547.1 hypothetical protein LEP1GSC116_3287 [Leptospira interrogans serovar Icterohaemorrhagiae str. Verdun HP]EMO16172.1 hypothetical protein LEP1GSC167_4433 [Leptospira interrogans serovar Copenhageni str. HAI0188]EMO37874.1 hypothetical protein LEP1GSC177_1788 [Leptospira interrogans str. MMD3731]EMY55441.1 hypothetical protein LEP1GSC204_0040 [Leptospira interrogans serovar Copenhageni str. M